MEGETIAVTLKHHEDKIKSLEYRVADCESDNKALHDLAKSVNSLAINMEYMAKEQKKQGLRLSSLEKEPAENYKTYKKALINAIVSGLLGLVFGALIAFLKLQ